jgi:endonuclease V-like protein UPF0215 family
LLAGCLATFRSRYRSTTPDLRIVGVDDGAFSPNKRTRTRQYALLVGVLFQGLRIRNIRTSSVEVDGRDANAKIAGLLKTFPYDIAMLSGIAFGGFNVVDIAKLARVTRKPVIAVSGEKPHNAAVYKALRMHFKDWAKRWVAVQNAWPLYSCKPLRNEPRLFFEVKGACPALARSIVTSTATISRLPEPIRVARMLARALGGPGSALV